MDSDSIIENISDYFKEITTNQPLVAKKEYMENIIKSVVDVELAPDVINEIFPQVANFIKMVIDERIMNANFILLWLVKHTSNYIGLYLIGLVVRKGANPNIYFPTGSQNLHILCALAIREEGVDFYFRHICMLLRTLGSNIEYPAYNLRDRDTNELDINYVQKLSGEGEIDLAITVNDFVRNQSKIPDEDLKDYINSVEDDMLAYFTIATDEVYLFQELLNLDFFKERMNSDIKATIKLFFDISTASALNIANQIVTSKLSYANSEFNNQKIPILVSVYALDEEMFNLMASKGAEIKYLSITNLIANYKKYKNKEIKLYKNASKMLLDAINIGADIDLYQFEMFTTAADYQEIDDLKKAYEVPKWKKLCAVQSDEPRQEIKQIAFELNLNYNMTEEKICNKLKQISYLDQRQFLESAMERQQDRITAEVSQSDDYTGFRKPQKSKCSNKSMAIRNPYAYNDGRMAFYQDPDDDEIYCFTSDTFSNLIATRKNPYNGKPLPEKFIETMKAQINVLRDLGLFDFNHSMKDTLREYFDRHKISNKKTDYAYNTVVKCLSLYGLSEDKFNSLSSATLENIIINEICGVKVNFFDVLTPKHQVILTSRIVYSMSKKNQEAEQIYQEIARITIGESPENIEQEQNDNEDDALNEYMRMLE
jgi:hypothetical protein